mgnify:FL=1
MIKFTSKVRRGLALARGLLIDSFDPDATPSARQVKSWKAKDQADFNAAMAWMEFVERQTEKPVPPDTAVSVATTPVV